MKRLQIISIGFLFLFNGCSSTEQRKNSLLKEERIPTEQPIAKLQGKLIYLPLPRTKSLRAYMGHEFFLIPISPNGQKEIIQPSHKISKNILLKFKDRNVELKGYYYPGHKPKHGTSFPTQPDGSPILQGGGLKVISIKLLE